MNGTHTTDQDVGTEERKSAVLSELSRILESPAFRGSKRCCRLLEYSVQQVLKGGSQEGLKERTIGIEVLQRPPDYDTSADAIVRVTANEVRKRLAQYYQGAENQGDPVIALPPGSYAVTFQWQTPAPAPVEPAVLPVVPSPPPEPPVPVAPAQSPRSWLWISVFILGSALIAAAALWIITRRPAAAPVRNADPLWSRLFAPGHKTNIVVSDTTYREIQFFLGRD